MFQRSQSGLQRGVSYVKEVLDVVVGGRSGQKGRGFSMMLKKVGRAGSNVLKRM